MTPTCTGLHTYIGCHSDFHRFHDLICDAAREKSEEFKYFHLFRVVTTPTESNNLFLCLGSKTMSFTLALEVESSLDEET